MLRRIVDEAFCSQAAGRALDLLGDQAFEMGDFVAAERWWRMLARPASESGGLNASSSTPKALALEFPDPQWDLAQLRAKQILARLFRGERDGLEEELTAFRTMHGQAKGHLAGRDGNYLEILQGLAGRPEAWRPPPGADAWSTFAGDPSRNHLAPQGPGRLLWYSRDDSPWPQPLGQDSRGEQKEDNGPPLPAASSNPARSLAFYPVIVGDRALVADARSVTAFDLQTGKRINWYDLARDGQVQEPKLSLKLPAIPDLRIP